MEISGISVYSLASAIVFFNIGLILIRFFRRNTMFLAKNSMSALAILFFLSLIRVLFPLDLERAIVFPSQTIFPSIIDILGMPIGRQFTVGTALLVTWTVGTVLILGKSWCVFAQEMRQVKKYRLIEDAQIQEIARQCLDDNAVVSVSLDVDVPKVMGLRKAYIYMPPLTLTDEETRFVLQHEFQHVKGGDFLIKLLYLFLKAVFWWNPIVHLFQQEVENLLELRCDAAITRTMTNEERISYLEAILAVAKQVSSRKAVSLIHASTLVNLKAQSFMQQRFEVILNRSASHSKSRMIRNIGIIVIVFLCSYFIIVQPVYEPSVSELENHVEITKANAYIVNDGKGQMELYVDGAPFGFIKKKELDIEPYKGLKIIGKEGNHE